MEIVLFGSLQLVFKNILTLILSIIITPLLLQVMISSIIGMIERTIRMDIRQFLNLLLFPGSLIRLSFLYLSLSLMGWEITVSHGNMVGANTAMAGGNNRRGFMIGMRSQHKKLGAKEVIVIATSSYLAWILALLMAIYYDPVIIALTYMLGSSASTWYTLLVISLVLGGMPIPQETMLPLEHIVANYPQFITGTAILCLSSAIIGYIYGSTIGQIWFIGILATIIGRHRTIMQQLDKIENSRIGGTEMMKEIMLL